MQLPIQNTGIFSVFVSQVRLLYKITCPFELADIPVEYRRDITSQFELVDIAVKYCL